MKMKAIVIATGIIGSSLVIYGSLAESSIGLIGLGLAAIAILGAGCFSTTSRSERDERSAKAAVIGSVVGQ